MESEQYEKEYLEFIKSNDIKVIRAVNRKFPELCNTQPLTGRFYENYRVFVAGIIKEHDAELETLLAQGESNLADKLEALKSLLMLHRVGELRADSTTAGLNT